MVLFLEELGGRFRFRRGEIPTGWYRPWAEKIRRRQSSDARGSGGKPAERKRYARDRGKPWQRRSSLRGGIDTRWRGPGRRAARAIALRSARSKWRSGP